MEFKGKRKEPSSSSSSDPVPNGMQQLVLYEMRNGHNLHIHGSGGVGKSWVLKLIRSQLTDSVLPQHIKLHLSNVLNMIPTAVVYCIICEYLEHDISRYVMVMSPTGMSAINIRARTVHNAHGAVPKTFDDDEEWAKHLQKLVKQAKEYNDLLDEFNQNPIDAVLAMRLIRCEAKRGAEIFMTRYIIFDEYPMIPAHTFDHCEEARRLCSRSPTVLWGGAQVIVMGDPLQLQVIPSRWRTEHGLSTDPCWEAKVWDTSDFKNIELTESMRQSEKEYIEMLQRMRELPKGQRDPRMMEILKRRFFTEDQVNDIIRLNQDLDPSFQQPTRLYPRIADVERVNLEELNKLETPYHEYHAQVYYVREYSYSVPTSTPGETKLMTYKMSQRIQTDRERGCTWCASTRPATAVNRQTHHYVAASVEVLREIESMIHTQLLPSNFPVPVTAPVKEGAQMLVVRNVDLKVGVGNGTPCYVKGYIDSKASVREHPTPPPPARFFHGGDVPVVMAPNTLIHTRHESDERVLTLELTPHGSVLAPYDVLLDYTDATSLVATQRQHLLNYTPWRIDLPVLPNHHSNTRDYWASDEYIEIWQLPLIPGYAMSFHRSQSLTLPNGVILNGADCFGGGMFYMGCSRPTSFNGLYVISCNERRIYADPKALRFIKKCRGQLDEEDEDNGLFASSSEVLF